MPESSSLCLFLVNIKLKEWQWSRHLLQQSSLVNVDEKVQRFHCLVQWTLAMVFHFDCDGTQRSRHLFYLLSVFSLQIIFPQTKALMQLETHIL